MVHTSIWASGQFSRLSKEARLTYIGLISLGDDDGRLKGNPPLIRGQIFPYDDGIKVSDVAIWLKEIEREKLVVKYEIDGEVYYFHPKWENYQQIRDDRRRDSHIPAPNMDFSVLSTKWPPRGGRVAGKVPPNISKDNISKENINKDVAFQAFWEKYPRKIGKKAAWRAWSKIKWTPELGLKIMQALDAVSKCEQWTKDKGRYTPHASTWINGERWEDDLSVTRKRTGKYDNIGSTISAS